MPERLGALVLCRRVHAARLTTNAPTRSRRWSCLQALKQVSVFFFCRFGILRDQRDQRILLAVRKLTEALQQFTLM